MRKTIFSVFFALLPLSSPFAQTVDAETGNRQVMRAAIRYIEAVACEAPKITVKNVVPLQPFTSAENQLDAKYAVIWSGDIGCQGGSGTSGAGIVIVKIGADNYYYVDPALSSPAVEFASPVRRISHIVGNRHDSIMLESKEYARMIRTAARR